MKNFTQELKKIIKEDPGVPIMSPDELRARSQTIVILTNEAPKELLALAGPDRKATLLSIDPPMITLPYQKGVFKVSLKMLLYLKIIIVVEMLAKLVQTKPPMKSFFHRQ